MPALAEIHPIAWGVRLILGGGGRGVRRNLCTQLV
jgi:hypothetical protein